MITAKPRPALRYHGGKWRLAPWIISHFPKHRIYVEPYGGGASVLLRKPRCYGEIYNDLDSEVVNFFKVLRDSPAELERVVRFTPFANEEFKQAFFMANDPIEQARRTVVRSFMGFNSAAVTEHKHTSRMGKPTTGFRANSNRSSTTPAHDWANYSTHIKTLAERLQGVVIENRVALEVISQHDSCETLFYLDPPYVANTRDKGSDYAHEMTDADHVSLAKTFFEIRGMAIISGYKCELYEQLFAGVKTIDKVAFADGAAKRIETLWINQRCVDAIERERSQQILL